MSLNLTYIGNPILKKATGPVTEFGEALTRHLPRMVEIMREEGGVGLAANQAGLDLRFAIVVANVDDEDREQDEILLMANPEILDASKEECVIEEGCLSIPGVREDLSRPERIRVRYQDADGKTEELDTGDFLARVIQHEIDHLDGVLFVERLSLAKRTLLKKKLDGIRAEHAEG